MHPEATRRLFELLESARPEDARAVLAGLGGPTVAAALTGARTPPPQRVVDFVLDVARPGADGRGGPAFPDGFDGSGGSSGFDGSGSSGGLEAPGGSQVLAALAARLISSPERADNVLYRRILRFRDPAADEALFGFGARRPLRWIRRAILRDRRGEDGRPVIAPALRARLLEAAALGDDQTLLRDLLRADDPELVLAALARTAGRLTDLVAAARALLTLAEHGQLGGVTWPAALRHADGQRYTVDELRECVRRQGEAQDWLGAGTLPDGSDELWLATDVCLWRFDPVSWEPLVAAAAVHGRAGGDVVGLRRAVRRDDVPADVRRRVAAHFPAAVAHFPDPGPEELVFAVDVLEKHASRDEPLDQYLYTLLDNGMRRGTLTAEEVLDLARPAAAVVAWTGTGTAGRGADRRGRADVRALIVELLRTELGANAAAWTHLLLAVGLWPGTLPELVRRAAHNQLAGVTRGEPGGSVRPSWHLRKWRPAERLLLGMAGRGTVQALLVAEPDGARRMALAEALRRGPTHRALAEYVLRLPEASCLLAAMAENPLTPLRDLRRIIEETPPDLGVLAATYCAPQSTGRLRELAVRRYLDAGGRLGVFHNEVSDPGRADWLGLVAAAFEPALFLRTLRSLRSEAPEDDLLTAYALLARRTGAEPVWVAEQERAGALDRMLPAVRESMLAGEAAPLLAAAETAARSSRPARVPREIAEGWPLEDMVRVHLDGRPERWAELARLLGAGVREPWRDLVRMSAREGLGAGV